MLCAFVLSPVVAACQAPVAEPPAKEAEQAFDRFYTAITKQQWDTAAGEMHPEAMAMLHRYLLQTAKQTTDAKKRKEMLQALGGVATVAAFEKIAPRTVFVRMMGYSWRKQPADLSMAIAQAKITVIGSVREDALLHIVYRLTMTVDARQVSTVTVTTAKLSDGKWKLLATKEISGLTAGAGE
jgi:hypothetical protein